MRWRAEVSRLIFEEILGQQLIVQATLVERFAAAAGEAGWSADGINGRLRRIVRSTALGEIHIVGRSDGVGAIGSYKTPQSHRCVTIESTEAAEMIVLASHLLGIVDKRSATTESTAEESRGSIGL